MRSPAPAFDLREALSQELQAALDELDQSEGRPRGIHRCRVRIKRARALARVGRTVAPGLSSVFNESARHVMRALGQARDLAALADAARATAKKASAKTAAALSIVAAALDAERTSVPPLDIANARSGLKDLLALALVWPEASPRQIKRGAARIARRARRARRQGRSSDEAVHRHEWRKREKDRFYAALLLDDAWPGRRRRKLGDALADSLGKERDALLLIGRLEQTPEIAGDAKAAKRALQLLHSRGAKFAARADELGDKLHAHGA